MAIIFQKRIRLFIRIIAMFIVVALSVLVPGLIEKRRAVNAVGGFPYQMGLTGVVIMQCVLTQAGECIGGALCAAAMPAKCAAYSEVSGLPAGGMGNRALLMNAVIAKIGLVPGGQVICGGVSPVLMDGGVCASAAGASFGF